MAECFLGFHICSLEVEESHRLFSSTHRKPSSFPISPKFCDLKTLGEIDRASTSPRSNGHTAPNRENLDLRNISLNPRFANFAKHRARENSCFTVSSKYAKLKEY